MHEGFTVFSLLKFARRMQKRRDIVETVHSVIKRKSGSFVRYSPSYIRIT